MDQRISTTYAQLLYESEKEYILDGIEEEQVLNALNIEYELGDFNFEDKIEQDTHCFIIEFKDIVDERKSFEETMNKKVYLILALMDNVKEVDYSYLYMSEGMKILVTVYTTKEQATYILGKDIKSYGESEEAVKELLIILYGNEDWY